MRINETLLGGSTRTASTERRADGGATERGRLQTRLGGTPSERGYRRCSGGIH